MRRIGVGFAFAACAIGVASTGRPAGHVRAQETTAGRSVVDALAQPGEMPFGDPTRLEDVARRLSEQLGAPVVLDRAALIRRELTADDTVQLALEGVRLKTSLQLLLDQVGLTFRVVPEDNLLVLTDDEGADDPYRRILGEIDVLHRELHELRDTVEALYDGLVPPEGGDPPVRNPTIIEPLPGAGAGPEPMPDPRPPAERRGTSRPARRAAR
jgi:hypothetical protein